MASTGNRKTILIVDDEPEVRSSTALLIETLGYQVVQASDGPSAIELLEQDESVRLLLSDVVLPGELSGAELAEKAKSRFRGLKILLTSGRPEFLEGLSFPVIHKPFRLAELGKKIAEVLGENAQRPD